VKVKLEDKTLHFMMFLPFIKANLLELMTQPITSLILFVSVFKIIIKIPLIKLMGL
jgi:hypothetical protein